ncbi:hypothetical protein PTI98_002033 [Pleurotus ostreatus]|nr:hypothetical protein PTI98_002033 [Pleurotus ostreatus]
MSGIPDLETACIYPNSPIGTMILLSKLLRSLMIEYGAYGNTARHAPYYRKRKRELLQGCAALFAQNYGIWNMTAPLPLGFGSFRVPTQLTEVVRRYNIDRRRINMDSKTLKQR